MDSDLQDNEPRRTHACRRLREAGYTTRSWIMVATIYEVLFALAFEAAKLVGDGLWPVIPPV